MAGIVPYPARVLHSGLLQSQARWCIAMLPREKLRPSCISAQQKQAASKQSSSQQQPASKQAGRLATAGAREGERTVQAL
jgi:hypothetical protein